MGQSRQTNRVSSHLTRHGLIVTIAAWLVLFIIAIAIARQNLSAPGLYYDEAVFGGLAKDFVIGQKRLHMPGCETVTMFNRQFPVFVQPYLGALKCWMLIPAFAVFGPSLAVLRLTSVFWAMLCSPVLHARGKAMAGHLAGDSCRSTAYAPPGVVFSGCARLGSGRSRAFLSMPRVLLWLGLVAQPKYRFCFAGGIVSRTRSVQQN
jgi:hypothetical protein